MRVDIDASYSLLAQRITAACAAASGGTRTPLGSSLAAVKNPVELSRK